MTEREILQNLKRVRERIAAAATRVGREPRGVTLVAATKGVPPATINAIVAAGVGIIGENRLQEARRKAAHMEGKCSWHMIGHLQTNKVKDAVGFFDLIQSVDSLRLAVEIDQAAEKRRIRQKILVEINLSGEKTKYGLARVDVFSFMREARRLENIEIVGLLTIPPLVEDTEWTRPFFRGLRQLALEIDGKEGAPLKILSMGMSSDFEVAIEEGATMVRVGTAIFGSRSRSRER